MWKTASTEEAIKAFNKSIELKPDFTDAWYSLGVAMSNNGQHDQAIKAYNKAVEIKPNYANAWYNLACTYSIKDDKKATLSHLEKAIQLDGINRKMAQDRKIFKPLWNDPEFKRITNS